MKWDPEGRKVAVREDNCERMELWVVDTAEGWGRCLVAVPRPLRHGSADRPEMYVLGWSGDGSRVFFLVAGRQTCCPHRGEEGWWVGSALRPLPDPYVYHWERIAGGLGDVAVAVRGARSARQAIVALSRAFVQGEKACGGRATTCLPAARKCGYSSAQTDP